MDEYEQDEGVMEEPFREMVEVQCGEERTVEGEVQPKSTISVSIPVLAPTGEGIVLKEETPTKEAPTRKGTSPTLETLPLPMATEEEVPPEGGASPVAKIPPLPRATEEEVPPKGGATLVAKIPLLLRATKEEVPPEGGATPVVEAPPQPQLMEEERLGRTKESLVRSETPTIEGDRERPIKEEVLPPPFVAPHSEPLAKDFVISQPERAFILDEPVGSIQKIAPMDLDDEETLSGDTKLLEVADEVTGLISQEWCAGDQEESSLVKLEEPNLEKLLEQRLEYPLGEKVSAMEGSSEEETKRRET